MIQCLISKIFGLLGVSHICFELHNQKEMNDGHFHDEEIEVWRGSPSKESSIALEGVLSSEPVGGRMRGWL